MHTAAPRPDIRTGTLLTGRVGSSSRAESGRGASTSRPGRCATIPRRAWHESSGDIGDTSDPEDPEARSRRLGFTTTSQLFKNAKKLERKTDKADKAEADLAMLDNLVDGNVESFEWFGGGGRNFSELVSQHKGTCAPRRGTNPTPRRKDWTSFGAAEGTFIFTFFVWAISMTSYFQQGPRTGVQGTASTHGRDARVGGCRPEPLPQSRHPRSQAGPAADRVPGHGRRADDVEVPRRRQVSSFYLSYGQFV